MYWVTDGRNCVQNHPKRAATPSIKHISPHKTHPPHREAHPGGLSSASLQKNTQNQMMHDSEAHHGRLSSASLQGKATLPAVSHREAHHGRLSSASLQKNTQNQMMHDREAHHGGRWSASRVEVGHV